MVVSQGNGAGEIVGLIGLGAMGRPMAAALMGAGYPLVGYDISTKAIEALVQSGARAAGSARELAAQVDVLFTMLPYSEDVEKALLGPDGVIEAARPGLVVVEASTIDPVSIRRMAKPLANRGIALLDMGVSASPKLARDRRGTWIVGGEQSVFERCRPVLQSLCDNGKLLYAGPLGTGKVIKLVNNMIGGIQMAAISEAFNLALRAGADPKVLYEAMSGSMGNCWALQIRPPHPGLVANSPADQDFAADFSVDYMAKDMSYAIRTGQHLGASLVVASLVQQLYLATSARGEGAKDFAAVVHLVQALSKAEPK